MARNMQPIAKRAKALGIEPAAMGYNKKTTKRNPKQARRKQSEYGLQLSEKQKVKFIYGVLEKQFRKYYEMAAKQAGITGHNLLQILESRLDNVVFRAGFARTRKEARQLVNHGHIRVNGNKVDIPSYLVKQGDVITVADKNKSTQKVKEILEITDGIGIPKWLELDKENVTAKVVALAEREDINDVQIQETLIVELYSK